MKADDRGCGGMSAARTMMPPPPPPLPPQPPAPLPPPPPPPRYDGPMRVIGIDPRDTNSYLYEQMFVNAPCIEPFSVSFRRLLDALRDDGECELRPTTIWLAYRKHKDLSYLQ